MLTRILMRMNAFGMHRYVARRNASVVCIAMGLLLVLMSPAAVFAQQRVVTSAAESAPVFVPAAGAGASANWAGYVAAQRGSTYTTVEGTWAVPTVEASSTDGMAANATWIGIGGVSSHDLLQAGTQAIVEDGKVSYQAWYELLPEFQTRIPLVVHGGDVVHVSLEEVSADRWQLIFLNMTTGQKYVRTFVYESSRSSAEWVEEMPLGVMGQRLGYLPLTDFGTTVFTQAKATVDGEVKSVNDLDADPLTMVTAGDEELAVPSVIADDGSFSIARTDTPVVTTRVPRMHRTYIPDGQTIIEVLLW